MKFSIRDFFGKCDQIRRKLRIWSNGKFHFLFCGECPSGQRTYIVRTRDVKVGLSPSKKICVICCNESPLKMIENAFYFILKAFSFSRYLSFVTTFWSCRKNGLIRKIRLTSKSKMPQPGLETIAIHILPNISQSKSNQTMKFGQLIKYNKKNIFLGKLCQK